MSPEQMSIPIWFYDCASDPTTAKGNEEGNISSRSKICCEDPPLLFIIIACNCLLLFLPSDLGGVCNLGLGLLGSVADHLGVIVIFGTAGLLVELLLGLFVVFIALGLTFSLLFGFLLFLGRGGLGFLRGRGFL